MNVCYEVTYIHLGVMQNSSRGKQTWFQHVKARVYQSWKSLEIQAIATNQCLSWFNDIIMWYCGIKSMGSQVWLEATKVKETFWNNQIGPIHQGICNTLALTQCFRKKPWARNNACSGTGQNKFTHIRTK